jgi:hypothetical protein
MNMYVWRGGIDTFLRKPVLCRKILIFSERCPLVMDVRLNYL